MLCLASISCSTWTAQEKRWAWAAVGCAAADVATTHVGREMGLREANPVLKDERMMIPVKAGVLALSAVSGELYDRTSAWRGAALLNCGVAFWNGIQIGRAQ